MANTYTSLHYHVVLSTKTRVRHISQQIEHRVWAFIGEIARKHRMTALQVGGIEDHIHALVTAPLARWEQGSVHRRHQRGERIRWVSNGH